MMIPTIAPGVANPYVVRRPPYPTRFHGTLQAEPIFSLPRQPLVHTVWMPHQLAGLGCIGGGRYWNGHEWITSKGCSGLGEAEAAQVELEDQLLYDVGSGVFRHPRSEGGGVFNSAISGGLGELSAGAKLGVFFGTAAVVGGITYALLKLRKKGR